MTTPGPAGWYDDPDDSNAQRYWDGEDWTGRLKPKAIARPPSQPVALPPLPTADPIVPEPAMWVTPRTAASSTVTIKAIGAVALVLIGGFSAYKLLSGKSEDHQISGNSDEHQTSGNSDQGQIKQLVQTWTNDLNNRDPAGLTSLMCSGSASQLPHDVFYTRDKIGPLSSAASNIDVSGDRATATIISTWSNGTHNSETDTYGKENGSWRICHTVNF
jgi:hypothetical protein